MSFICVVLLDLEPIPKQPLLARPSRGRAGAPRVAAPLRPQSSRGGGQPWSKRAFRGIPYCYLLCCLCKEISFQGMCAFTPAHACVRLRVRTCARMRVHAHAYASACVHAHIQTQAHVHGHANLHSHAHAKQRGRETCYSRVRRKDWGR